MRCFVCFQDFQDIGYWDGKSCSENIKNTNKKISDLLTELIGDQFLVTINSNDRICNTCHCLIIDYYAFHRKAQILKHLIMRQVTRSYDLGENYDRLSIDQKSLRTFFTNDFNEICCKRCYYKTRFLDTVTPHFLFHNRDHNDSVQFININDMENMDVDGALKTITDIVKLSESTLRDNSRILTMPVPVQNQNSFQIYNDGGVSTLSTSLLNECNRLTQEEAAAFDSINMSMKSESCAIKVEHEKEEAKTQICSSEQTIHCKFCDQYFSNTDAASKHMQKFHLCCSECNKIFDNRIKLQKHLNYVHHGQIYKCDLCTNTYRSRSGLIKHIRHHVQQHPYTCNECGKGFWDRVPYGEHIGQHTQKSNYICEKCGKTFLRMSTYQLHLKYHENSTPFKCKLCPKAYASRSSVVIHRRRVHTGEMPFRCTHCSRQFPTRAAYKIHLIYHTQEYPFLCSVCPSKGFIRRRDYTNHMVKIHQVETTSNTSKLKSFFKVSLRGST